MLNYVVQMLLLHVHHSKYCRGFVQ